MTDETTQRYKAFAFQSVHRLNEWLKANEKDWTPMSIADTNAYITVLCKNIPKYSDD